MSKRPQHITDTYNEQIKYHDSIDELVRKSTVYPYSPTAAPTLQELIDIRNPDQSDYNELKHAADRLTNAMRNYKETIDGAQRAINETLGGFSSTSERTCCATARAASGFSGKAGAAERGANGTN